MKVPIPIRSLCSLVILLSCASFAAENNRSSRVLNIRPGDDLAAAVAACNDDKLDVLAFGPGEFTIPGTLEFQKRFGENGLAIIGAGAGLTRLVFHNAAKAIEVKLDTDLRKASPSFSIRDLTLLASGNCGTAIDIRRGNQAHSGGIAPKNFTNLVIEGGSGRWTTGIEVSDLTFCTFRDLTFRLPKKKSTAIHLTGDESPVDHHISGLRLLGGQTGVKVTGTVEGVYMQQVTMIGTDVGIDWNTTSHEPLLSLGGSHINASSFCIRAHNLLQPIITGNLFYQANPSKPWTGIAILPSKATRYDLLQISSNTFHGDPNHTAKNTGLHIEAASAGVIQGNIYSAVDTGILLGKKAQALQPKDSIFVNSEGTGIARPSVNESNRTR